MHFYDNIHFNCKLISYVYITDSFGSLQWSVHIIHRNHKVVMTRWYTFKFVGRQSSIWREVAINFVKNPRQIKN